MPQNRLTPATQAAVALAGREAQLLASAFVDVEHLFLGLCKVEELRHPGGPKVEGVDAAETEALRLEVADFARRLTASGFDCTRSRRRLRALWRESHPFQQVFQALITERCREVLDRAEKRGEPPGALAALMLEVLEEPSLLLDRLLSEVGARRSGLAAALRSGAAAGGAEAMGAAAAPMDGPDLLVLRFGRNLTELARAGDLHPIQGRDEEIKQVARILLQAKKSNAVLVGDAGVGKTAIIEGLAVRMASPTAPPDLAKLRLIDLSPGALVAGTKYRGEFEERLLGILKEAEADPSIVIFIDEIHLLLGAGGGGGSMDAAALLKPALARARLRVIGATTTGDYRRIEADPALERRFQVVWVEEPSRATAVAILESLRPRLQQHHGVTITDAALEIAVDLSVRHLPDLRLPDKAIDLVDQACSRTKLLTFSPRRKDEAENQGMQAVDAEDVANVVAERCRVPVANLTEAEAERLLRIEEALGKRVLGQEHALTAIAEAVRSSRVGLRDRRGPAGVFLLLGPTGTGKTEIARALAEFLFGSEDHLIRLDMSEFSEKHSVAKLIGAPPGYVGFDQGGQLTDKVRNQPHSVVLFDEAEKAHPEVFDLFLQVFDDGRLTDSRGRRASFVDTIVILTSNLGGSVLPKASRKIGLAAGAPDSEAVDFSAYEARVRDAVSRFLRPELRNRIHREIILRPLGPDVVERIIDQMVGKLNARLESRALRVELSAAARAKLMERGFSPEEGARAMQRAVRDLIEEPLGFALISGGIAPGSNLRVVLEGDSPRFEQIEPQSEERSRAT